MTTNEFEAAFRKGHGRAWLHVKWLNGDDASIRKILERGSVEILSYDPQCEGDRSQWVYKMLMMTDYPQHFEKHIIDNLRDRKIDDSWDVSHAASLLACYAQDGSEEARTSLNECFVRSESNAFWVIGHPIIEANGLSGFLSLARQIGEKLVSDEDCSDDECLLFHAIELHGEDEVLDKFKKAANTCEYVDRYYNEVFPQYKERIKRLARKKGKKRTREERRLMFHYSLEEVLEELELAEKKFPAFFMRFGDLASDREVEKVITHLEKEQRTDQLIRYAWIFRRRYSHGENPMPERLLVRLLELLTYDDKALISAVSYSLTKVCDERIRKIAKERFMSDSKRHFPVFVELMESSAKQEDTEEIANFFEKMPRDLDDEEVHSIIMDLIKMVENLEMDSHLQRILNHSYYWTPCGMCRDSIYQLLYRSGRLSANMAHEQRHDAYQRE